MNYPLPSLNDCRPQRAGRRRSLRVLRVLLVGAALGSIGFGGMMQAAVAAERPFPSFAKRGTMRPDLFPGIVIDGRPRILTPGARIWSAENLIDMPASLPQKTVVVNYTEDENAYIDRVWILTPEEAAQSPKAQNINQPRP